MAEIKITGDSSLAIVFGNSIHEEISRQIRAIDQSIHNARNPGILETVPTYCTLMVHYDPEILPYRDAKAFLEKILSQGADAYQEQDMIIEIPVCYGGTFGEDLSYVAAYHNMTEQQVIDIHTQQEYRIYMLGFTPGFAYMGGMDEAIATPRLKTPRIKIPAGSVGIAGSQTGIYPLDSPGGWQLIGRTPVKLYDPRREHPILLEAGMQVKFVPISEPEYHRIAALAEGGRYTCPVYRKDGENVDSHS